MDGNIGLVRLEMGTNSKDKSLPAPRQKFFLIIVRSFTRIKTSPALKDLASVSFPSSPACVGAC